MLMSQQFFHQTLVRSIQFIYPKGWLTTPTNIYHQIIWKFLASRNELTHPKYFHGIIMVILVIYLSWGISYLKASLVSRNTYLGLLINGI